VTRFLVSAAAAALALAASPALAQTQPAAQDQTLTRAIVLDESQASFKSIDSNNDGNLTKAELEASQAKALQQANAARDKDIEADFKKLDSNNDGSISLAEFKAVAPQVRVRMTPDQAVAEFDSNKDGKITLEEYRKPRLAAFDKADANHDGTVTMQELQAARRR
jgi:Ca2+-binding EF-hand superfamily protein